MNGVSILCQPVAHSRLRASRMHFSVRTVLIFSVPRPQPSSTLQPLATGIASTTDDGCRHGSQPLFDRGRNDPTHRGSGTRRSLSLSYDHKRAEPSASYASRAESTSHCFGSSLRLSNLRALFPCRRRFASCTNSDHVGQCPSPHAAASAIHGGKPRARAQLFSPVHSAP